MEDEDDEDDPSTLSSAAAKEKIDAKAPAAAPAPLYFRKGHAPLRSQWKVADLQHDDWKLRFIERYLYLKRTGTTRCSLCMTKTSALPNTSWKVRLCPACLGSQARNKTKACEEYGLTAGRDLLVLCCSPLSFLSWPPLNLPRSLCSHPKGDLTKMKVPAHYAGEMQTFGADSIVSIYLYLSRDLQRAAYKKFGGKDGWETHLSERAGKKEVSNAVADASMVASFLGLSPPSL